MAPRTESTAAHEAALQMLYAMELDQQAAAQVREWYRQAHPLAPETLEEASALLDLVLAHQAAIESLIARHSHHWRVERIGIVDRCLLKLAIAEMLQTPGPTAAVASINEALHMARRFSQPGVVGFLHGILEAVAAEIQTPSAATQPPSTP